MFFKTVPKIMTILNMFFFWNPTIIYSIRSSKLFYEVESQIEWGGWTPHN